MGRINGEIETLCPNCVRRNKSGLMLKMLLVVRWCETLAASIRPQTLAAGEFSTMTLC